MKLEDVPGGRDPLKGEDPQPPQAERPAPRAQGNPITRLGGPAEAVPAPLSLEGLRLRLRGVPEVRRAGGKLAGQRSHARRANNAAVLAHTRVRR